MSYKKNIVLLLTACIKPQGMPLTALQDPIERAKQYEDAILFYLYNTNLNVVVVENTMSYLSNDFINKNERIEYITFDGNNIDKIRGKGFAEAVIIEYALNNSEFIKSADYIVKITGRLIIESLNHVIKQLNYVSNDYDNIFANITWNKKIAYSYFFIVNKLFLKNYFLLQKNKIDDSNDSFFEHVLMQCILQWKRDGHTYNIINYPIIVKGKSGSTGEDYNRKGLFLYFRLLHKFKYYTFKLIS